jgi:hypothetical protein
VGRIVSDWISIRPEFVLAQIDVVIPGYPVATSIHADRSEERWIREQAELGPREKRSTVVDPLLSILEANEQAGVSNRLDRLNPGY